ncbi:hypothetical protein HS045_04950 [Planomonospora sp. ID82291]|nr:hypothetical protein [Planomonospora sp. ID82291]
MYRYAVRRSDSTDDVADVIAETFLVAWRRLDDVPDGDAAVLWLYGAARRQPSGVSVRRRGRRRRGPGTRRTPGRCPAGTVRGPRRWPRRRWGSADRFRWTAAPGAGSGWGPVRASNPCRRSRPTRSGARPAALWPARPA